MQNLLKKWKVLGVLLIMTICVAGGAAFLSAKNVQAATKTGFQTINGKTYYIDADGSKHKGWLFLNGKAYLFNSKTGVQYKGWVKNSKGQKRLFSSKSGAMYTGWVISNGKIRYFDENTGYMKTGWMTKDGKRYYFSNVNGLAATGFTKNSSGQYRYFSPSTGAMAEGWAKNSKSQYRYFSTSSGIMYTGLKKVGNYYYFFSRTNGVRYEDKWIANSAGQKRYFNAKGRMLTGFQTIRNRNYYLDPKTGIAASGWKTIDGKRYYFHLTTFQKYIGEHVIDGVRYTFDSTGALISSMITTPPSSQKTITNYLLGAVQPVGQALYIWGGGWNDATRKGVSPLWKQWYDSQNLNTYDYNNYRDLSTTNRAKGLDCSGFVGWAAYQVMQTQSGVGGGYTVVSGEVGSSYQDRGWGTVLTQANLSADNWRLKAGDVGYNSGHTWIVIGQCSDKSVVIVHSTPQAGCQIAGTPTPDGSYGSQAIELARKYMTRYEGYNQYPSIYHPSSGNYIRNGNYLRWNSSTLSDPDGYLNMTADQILADMFGS